MWVMTSQIHHSRTGAWGHPRVGTPCDGAGLGGVAKRGCFIPWRAESWELAVKMTPASLPCCPLLIPAL